MKRTTILSMVAAALLAPPFTAYAAKPATKPTVAKPQVKVTTTAKAPKPQPVKAVKTTSHAHAAKPVKAMKPATAVKPVKATKPAKTTAPAKTAKAAKSTTSTTTTTTTTSNTTGTTTPVTLTPVQQKLQKNTKLTAKLHARLPVGTDLMAAAAGFKNLGQFVAAVNVSNNLHIPFADLKTKMVTDGLSLGQSIQALRPTTSGTVEASRAEYDARGMILETEAATTSSTPPATSTAPTTT